MASFDTKHIFFDKENPNTPGTTISYVSNTFTRTMYFKKAGDKEMGHSHNYDHVTLLALGKIKITVGDKETEFTAPKNILIKKNVNHIVEALEDGTLCYCVHPLHDRNNPEYILDPDSIPEQSSHALPRQYVPINNDE
jgi:hypothetical protein